MKEPIDIWFERMFIAFIGATSLLFVSFAVYFLLAALYAYQRPY